MSRAEQRKRIALIDTGDGTTDRLYKAVVAYIEQRGGAVVVIGGVQTQEWPGERPGCFTIGVKITGRKPVYAASGVRGAEKGDRT